MSTELTKPNALNALALRVQCDPDGLIKTLKMTVFKGASDAEFNALVIVANTYELNPILKELYAFPAKGGGIVPVVGIDGWLKIINRQPNFDGMTTETSADGQSATTTIYCKGRNHPTVVTEYLSECSRGTEPWKTMPRRMLRHKAIIQAARVAFGISGVQDEDEAADTMRNVTPNNTPSKRETPNIPGKKREADPVVEDEPEAEPAPANPVKKEPTGNQKKARHERDAKFKGISEKSAKGKTWFEVATIITGKQVTLTTFSTTDAEALRELEKDTMLRVTLTVNDNGFALESFELLGEEGLV